MAKMVSKEDLITNSSFQYLLVDVATSEVLDEAFEEHDILFRAKEAYMEDPTLLLCIYERKSILVF